MNNSREPLKPITILLADDNEDDRLMAREALAESFVIGSVLRSCFRSGAEGAKTLGQAL